MDAALSVVVNNLARPANELCQPHRCWSLESWRPLNKVSSLRGFSTSVSQRVRRTRLGLFDPWICNRHSMSFRSPVPKSNAFLNLARYHYYQRSQSGIPVILRKRRPHVFSADTEVAPAMY